MPRRQKPAREVGRPTKNEGQPIANRQASTARKPNANVSFDMKAKETRHQRVVQHEGVGDPTPTCQSTRRRREPNTESRTTGRCSEPTSPQVEGPTTQRGRAAWLCPVFYSIYNTRFVYLGYPRRSSSLGTINLSITILV